MSAQEIEMGELRSLLHQPPSLAVWEAMCALVSGPGWDERVEEWGPYAAEIMDRSWPDALRVLRREWVMAREVPGVAQLARRLVIKQAAPGELKALLGRVLALAPRLHVLEMHVELKTTLLDGLLRMETPLRELELVYPCRLRAASSGEAIAARADRMMRLIYPIAYAGEDEAMCAVEWPALRVLGLGGYGVLEPAALRGWLDRAPRLEELELSKRYCEAALVEMARRELPMLRTLWLDSVRLNEEALEALERAPWLHQLRGGLYRGYARPYCADQGLLPRIKRLHERILAHETPICEETP
jgi:hypothetical protein